jgi:hypothetical protein
MALSFSDTSRPDVFDRHIKRLAWYALLASIALLIPIVRSSVPNELGLVGALGAMVLVVAVLAVVRDVGHYVRQERARRREGAVTARRAGACSAADAIQDRVANSLAVTIGYVDFLVEDEHLPLETRDHAQRALGGALAAARVVSTFRKSLGCGAQVNGPLSDEGTLRHGAEQRTQADAPATAGSTPWSYEQRTRTIRSQDGVIVANLSSAPDDAGRAFNGRLIAEAPALWDVLGDAQRLGIYLLADEPLTRRDRTRIRQILEHINEVTARVLAP